MTDSWEQVPISQFQNCCDSLQYNEMICIPNFVTKESLYSSVIGTQRLDIHIAANGIYTLDDFLKANSVPDENATIDQICEICGQIFNYQMLRFDGYNILSTLYTSVYMHPNYQIKNKLLLSIVNSFRILSNTIEDITFSNRVFVPRAWSYNERYRFPTIDLEQTKKDLINFKNDSKYQSEAELQNVLDYALFNLNFSQFLSKLYQSVEDAKPFFHIFSNPPVPPSKSSLIANSWNISSTFYPGSSSPPRVAPLDHEKAIQMFKSFCQDVSTILSDSFIIPSDLIELYDFLTDWSLEHQKCVFLTRFILRGLLIGDSSCKLLNNIPFIEYLSKFCRIRQIPVEILNSNIINDNQSVLQSIVFQLIDYSIHPVSSAYSLLYNNGCEYFKIIISLFFEAQKKTNVQNLTPKTSDFKQLNTIIQSPVTTMATDFIFRIIRNIINLGIACNIFNPRDYFTLFFIQRNSYINLETIYEKQRILEAAARVQSREDLQHKKHVKIIGANEVSKEISINWPDYSLASIPKIHMIIGIKNLYTVFMRIMRLAQIRKACPLENRMYENPKQRYNKQYGNFSTLMMQVLPPFEEINSFSSAGNETQILQTAQNEIQEAKKFLMMCKGKPGCEKAVAALKASMISSITISKWKPGDKLEIEFLSEFPTFRLVPQ